MNNLAGLLGHIQELDTKIQEGEESLEEMLHARNKIEKDLRRNSRELAAKNEELVDLRNMKESLMLKKGKLWKEYEKEEFDRNIDSVEREASPPRNPSTSHRDPQVPKTSLSASAPSVPGGMPHVVVENPGGLIALASTGIQVGAQVRWEYNGVKYYAEELRFMPTQYRYIQGYVTMTSFYISGLDQRMKEYQAVEVLATCDGWWPPRNCGVLALQVLRKASEESPEGSCIAVGGFIRLANRELAQAFMMRTHGLSHRNRTIAVQPCQEFALRDKTRNVNLLGTQRFFRGVWNSPIES